MVINMNQTNAFNKQIEEYYSKGEHAEISYCGLYAIKQKDNTIRFLGWDTPSESVNSLLHFMKSGRAQKIIECIGRNDNLQILNATINMTAASDVKSPGFISEECGLEIENTIYGLEDLVAHGLIYSEKKDNMILYGAHPNAASALIMMLAGINIFDKEI